MATGLSYIQRAEEDLICPLCLELFTDPHIPKLLDCPHVYCQTCLVKLLAGSGDKQTFSCPECRKSTTVPDGDVDNLKTILRLRSLAEKHAKHLQQTGQNEIVCAQGPGSKGDIGILFCKDHTGEKLHFYCLTCQVSVCQACLVLMHERPKHEIKSVKDVHSEKVKILEATIKRNEKLISDFRKNIQHVTRCEQKIYASIKESEQEIDRVVAKAINDINTQAQKLKKDVHYKNEDMLIRCKEHKTDRQEKARKLQTVVDEANKILEIETSHKYLKSHNMITKLFIDLEADRKAQMPTRIPEENVSKYSLHQLEDEVRSNTLQVASFGFNEQFLKDLGAVQTRVVRKLQLQHVYNFPHPITSVACGLDSVVVNMQSKKLIEVYRQNSGKLIKRQCRLEPTEKNWHPMDVAVTKADRILVARWNCVEEFECKGKHTKTITFNKNSGYEDITTSVTTTKDGHILASNIHCPSEIKCYSKDGQSTIHSVNVDRDNDVIWKLAAISNEYVAASNLESKVKTYQLSKNFEYHSSITVPEPTALCYDEETKCLLIGSQDMYSPEGAVIEQYCWQTGAKIATLAQGLKDPQDMALTGDGEYLVVADENTLKFYKISVETMDVDGRLWNRFNARFPKVDTK